VDRGVDGRDLKGRGPSEIACSRVDGHIGQLGVESSPTRVGERGKGMLQFWIKVRFAAGRPRFAQRGRQTL